MKWALLGACLLAAASACRKSDPSREWEGKLQSSNPEVRARAARELGKHGAEAAASVERLIEMLRSSNADERQSAATALGKIGEPARPAGPALIAVLTDEEWPVRRAAALALGEIGDPTALDALRRLASDPDSLVRKAAAESVAKLSP